MFVVVLTKKTMINDDHHVSVEENTAIAVKIATAAAAATARVMLEKEG